jgi:hypothetical protein
VRVAVDVLMQPSTKGDIDELMAAANRKHGKRALPRQPEHFYLQSVEVDVNSGRFHVSYFAVVTGLDVSPAGEKEAAQSFDRLGGRVVRRDLSNDPSRFLDSPSILFECG